MTYLSLFRGIALGFCGVLCRMINSGRFPGLQWMDQEKMVFRVPWVHAKKRDYNQERDAALFREWAIHSG